MARASSNSVANGLLTASTILENPDTYSGEDAMGLASCRFQLMSWLTYGDSGFTKVLEAVKAKDSMPTMASYSDAEKGLLTSCTLF